MIPNHHTALDAGGTLCLHRIPCCPDVSERGRCSHARGRLRTPSLAWKDIQSRRPLGSTQSLNRTDDR
jgi:hypothetical protein